MANEDELLRLIQRLYKTQDGKDFVELYLTKLQVRNYNRLIHSVKDNRDELIGYGQCLQEIIKVFRNSSDHNIKSDTLVFEN